MTDWFARPVLHVSDVETSLRFYVERLGFTVPWRAGPDGRADVAQVDRQGCALILAEHWPAEAGKGLMFISLNVEASGAGEEVAKVVVEDPDSNQLFFSYPGEPQNLRARL